MVKIFLSKIKLNVTTALLICLAIPQTLHAEQMSCNLYQMKIDEPTSFDDLKKINFSKFIQDHFSPLGTSLQASFMFEGLEVQSNRKELSPQQAVLALPETVQDIFWLNSIAYMTDSSYYFKSAESDFAPYVHRALKRQGLTQEAMKFANAMAVYGHRYDGFDENEKSIKAFPMKLAQADFDEAFEKMFTYGNETEEWRQYKEAAREQRKQTLAQPDTSSITDFIERINIYSHSPENIEAEKLLADFPNRQALYENIRQFICKTPEAKNWYDDIYNKTSDNERVYFLAIELATNENLGPKENWAAPYKYVHSLFLLQGETFNGGINQYFENTSYEDLPELRKTLKALKLDDVLTIVDKVASFYKKDPEEAMFDPQLAAYTKTINVDDLLDKVVDAMVQVARKNDILPQ